MKVKFCGAARQVTGSSHLITLNNGCKILLDCGLYQGSDDDLDDFNNEWLFDPNTIDYLIVSHAHIDHTGKIPKLVRDGFNGEILCTHATRSLAALMLMDSARIQEKDAEYMKRKGYKTFEPLYTSKDVHKAMSLFLGLSYERWHYVTDGVRVYFRDAGHVLGSASITLEIEENGKIVRFGFTGDIGRPNRPIIKDPIPMPEVDYLICESTYGGKEHRTSAVEEEDLLHIIEKTCVKNRGKLLIPSFSIGRTQELVYMLDQLSTDKLLPKIPVYVDSPLATNATDIFRMHPECFDEELMEYLEYDSNPWGFDKLRFVKTSGLSKRLNSRKEPCIIISSSGMANAGRILHHIYNSIENPNNAVLIVGYCSPQTTGGRLRRGHSHIYLYNKELKVNASVYTLDGFSAHADRTEIYETIRHQRSGLKKLFLTHGEYGSQLAFKEYLHVRGFDNVEIPDLGEEFEL